MSYLAGKSLGLENLSTNIVDSSYLSTYFNITEFNPTFGAGKNLLIVNTTSLLSKTPNIQIEARDSNNNFLYIDSAQTIDPTSGKQTYYYSLYVYDNLTYGTGKITIVGNTSNNQTVKWSANIAINPNNENKSKIVFFNKPELNVIPFTAYTLSSSTEYYTKELSGRFTSQPHYPVKDFDITNNYNPNKLDYRIIDNSGQFISGMENFPITLYVTQIKPFNSTKPQNVSDTSSILVKQVLNNTTLLLSEPYIYQNNKISEITAGTYTAYFNTVTYNPSLFSTSSYLQQATNLNGGNRPVQYSYALVGYTNLNTFSGYIQKHKIYKKNLSATGDYALVTDELFSSYELLQDFTTPNKSFDKLGTFYTQFHINNFWFTSSNSFNLYNDNSTFLNGMIISGSNVSNGYSIVKANTSYTNRNSSYAPIISSQVTTFSGSSYDSNFLHFYPNSRYTLSLNAAFLNTSLPASLSFYITSSSPNISKEIGYDSTKGVLIGTLSSPVNTLYDSTQTFDFNFLNDTNGTLVIYGSGFKSAIVANLSITPTNTYGFSQDVYFTKLQFDVTKPNDIFEIKSELYDKDGNLAYNNLDTVQYFDPSGSTVSPNLGSIGSSVYIAHLSSSTLITNTITANTINATTISGAFQGTSSYSLFSGHAETASFALNAGGGGGGGGNGYWNTSSINTNNIYNTNSGSVGIGTSNPTHTLEVVGDISCSVLTSSLILLKNSILFDYSSSTNTVILQNYTGAYNAAFFDYVAISASNLRAGTVFSCFTSSNIHYTEYSTTDIGNTSQVTMSVDLDNSNIRLLSSVPVGYTWNIKAFGRYL